MRKLKTYLIITCILFGASDCWSQRILLLDILSNEPVSYAHAVLNSKGQQMGGFYSDENGQIYLHNLIEYDSLIISCLGFQDKIITSKILQDTIYLDPKNEVLDEVSVYAGRSIQEIYVGTNKSLKTQYTTGYPGIKILVFVPNTKGENKSVEKF